MGVVSVSTSAARNPLGLSTKFSTHLSSQQKRPVIISFKTDITKNTALIAPRESVCLPVETAKENEKRLRTVKKRSERLHAALTDEAISSTFDLDYNEAAAKLEHIFKRSPSDKEVKEQMVKGRRRRRKRGEAEEEGGKRSANTVVRNRRKKAKRLSLETRIATRTNKEGEVIEPSMKGKQCKNDEDEDIDRLVREYSASTDLVSLDWKKMKIPPVLASSEHAWLFKLIQPMKAILQVKENIQNDLGREPTDCELAEATNMDTFQLRKNVEVGRAARNKLIKDIRI
ncbi:RNA polymerase sigma factor sigE, chloroplastic mitochondrial [Olea europaea subsp. europaea]|uniref:RNA polymerase sigma factor sigE, chloroplastic mitochondrial n=1 Tax=Olea europaea subsp. europaea TaxID=158383 RepID=A0A8S0QZ02_OLEEU|nr:RNA polymerase sigma factor sigE, chloroplastic mitochondrial [Olea europaea subsp. europaea]